MPIAFTTDHALRLVTAIVERSLTLPDLEGYVADRLAAGVYDYDQVIDVGAAEVRVAANEILATVQDDPDTSGTQYTIVEVPANNVNFLALGVKAGDTLRAQFSVDSLGATIYEEFQIDAVLSENSVRLVTGLDAAVNTPRFGFPPAGGSPARIGSRFGCEAMRRAACGPRSVHRGARAASGGEGRSTRTRG